MTVLGASVTLSNGETSTLADLCIYTIPANASVTLTQTTANIIRASVVVGANASVTLKGVNIKACKTKTRNGRTYFEECGAVITCNGNATIILADGTTNTLYGGVDSSSDQHPYSYPAIQIGDGYTLTIKGETARTGKLVATGGSNETPGIGAIYSYDYAQGQKAGNIIIDSCDITAKSGGNGTGVGIGAAAHGGKCGNITIRDSITKVVASIGAATGSSCGTITIGTHLKQIVGSNDIRTITPMSYTISFNANGGRGGTDKNLVYDTTIGTLPQAIHDSFDFGGWWTATSGGTQVTESTKVTGVVTYYAHWSEYTWTAGTKTGALQEETSGTAKAYTLSWADKTEATGWDDTHMGNTGSTTYCKWNCTGLPAGKYDIQISARGGNSSNKNVNWWGGENESDMETPKYFWQVGEGDAAVKANPIKSDYDTTGLTAEGSSGAYHLTCIMSEITIPADATSFSMGCTGKGYRLYGLEYVRLIAKAA